MRSFPVVLRMELRRMLAPMIIAVPFLLLVLSVLLAVIHAKMAPTFSVERYFMDVVQGMILYFGPPLIGGGMLAGDIKDHWARTTLMRPVTRAEFLVARVTAVSLMTMATITINAWLPLVVPAFIFDKTVVLEASVTIPMFFLVLGQAYLLIVLMTLLSCWLPGIMNVVVLTLWAIFSALIGGYVQSQYWDIGFLTVAKDFIFPSGFLDAAAGIRSGGIDLWSGILWGLAGASGFTALAIWAFNRVTIETGSE